MSSRICGPNTLNLVITVPHAETEGRKLYIGGFVRNVDVAKKCEARTDMRERAVYALYFLPDPGDYDTRQQARQRR